MEEFTFISVYIREKHFQIYLDISWLGLWIQPNEVLTDAQTIRLSSD